MIAEHLSGLVENFTSGEDPDEWDLAALHSAVRIALPMPADTDHSRLGEVVGRRIEEQILDMAEQRYEELEQALGSENLRQWERMLMLQVMDMLWVRHLTALDELRQGIGLRLTASKTPWWPFKKMPMRCMAASGRRARRSGPENLSPHYHSRSAAAAQCAGHSPRCYGRRSGQCPSEHARGHQAGSGAGAGSKNAGAQRSLLVWQWEKVQALSHEGGRSGRKRRWGRPSAGWSRASTGWRGQKEANQGPPALGFK